LTPQPQPQPQPQIRRAALDRPFSLYLDVVRTLAAVAVVIAHFGYFHIFDARQIAALPDFGREAVIAFFVLSGFVIAYSAETKNRTLADYALARCARLYSVVLPVLLLAFVLSGLAGGLAHAPIESGYELNKPWVYVPFHLLFLGDLWSFAERPPWLLPYWSLDYEAWYYVLFGAVWYLKGRRRVLAVAAILALVGPRLWLLLPVWLGGVALYRWQRAHVLPVGAARALWALTTVAIAVWGWLDPEPWLREVANGAWPFPFIRMGSADRVLADYAVGAMVLLNFAGARHAGVKLSERAGAAIRRLSSHTFTLYLSHGVVIGAWQALIPSRPGHVADIAALACAIALVAAALQPFTVALQRGLHRQLPAMANAMRRGWRPVQ
jgi:peptidoglycan/LPS O-acetylase OafA/YrhL